MSCHLHSALSPSACLSTHTAWLWKTSHTPAWSLSHQIQLFSSVQMNPWASIQNLASKDQNVTQTQDNVKSLSNPGPGMTKHPLPTLITPLFLPDFEGTHLQLFALSPFQALQASNWGSAEPHIINHPQKESSLQWLKLFVYLQDMCVRVCLVCTHTEALRVCAQERRQQICIALEAWGEINCRTCDLLLPEWCACCQFGVSLSLSESYYTNQLLIQLIMKNMQKDISRSWFRACYVWVIEPRKLIWVRRLWFLILNVTDFHSFELKSDLQFIFLRVQLYSSIDIGHVWSCILSLFSYAWRIRAFMDAQINRSLRSIRGCLAVFICRTHLIAFIHKIVYRWLNYYFIAFIFPRSVTNDKFWSFVLLCSFWTKSYLKNPKNKKPQPTQKNPDEECISLLCKIMPPSWFVQKTPQEFNRKQLFALLAEM